MARISYNEAKEFEPVRNNDSSFDFFTLKNDGDKAAVRILCDSPKDFIIYTVHDVTLDGRRRKIGCLRSPKGNSSECPLCAAGQPSRNVFLIPMIQYFQDESGNIFGELVVWERSLSYARKIAGMIDEYGPLSDTIMVIKRNGSAGDIHTTYDIMLGSPKIYRDDVYFKDEEIVSTAKDEHLFDGLIINRSYDDVNYFVSNGTLPPRDTNDSSENSVEDDYEEAKEKNVPEKEYEEEVNETPAVRTAPTYRETRQPDRTPPVREPSRRPTRYY